jgi:hypothetical protein
VLVSKFVEDRCRVASIAETTKMVCTKRIYGDQQRIDRPVMIARNGLDGMKTGYFP